MGTTHSKRMPKNISKHQLRSRLGPNSGPSCICAALRLFSYRSKLRTQSFDSVSVLSYEELTIPVAVAVEVIHSHEDKEFVRRELRPRLEDLANVSISLRATGDLWGQVGEDQMPCRNIRVIVVSPRYIQELQEFPECNNWGEEEWRKVERLHRSPHTYLILTQDIQWDTLFHSTLEILRVSCLKLRLFQWREDERTNTELLKILQCNLNA